MTSKHVHIRILVVAQMFVFNIAMDDSTLEAYGAPPLKPAHPIQSNPAPVNVINTLFGGKLSLSFFNLGPTYKITTKKLSKTVTGCTQKPAGVNADH